MKVVNRYGRVQAMSIKKANQVAQDAFANIVSVQAYVAEDIEVRRYCAFINDYLSVIRHTLVSGVA